MSDKFPLTCFTDPIWQLVDGTANNNGRLQMTLNGVSGTVCDDRFNRAAATIVCRNLGFK